MPSEPTSSSAVNEPCFQGGSGVSRGSAEHSCGRGLPGAGTAFGTLFAGSLSDSICAAAMTQGNIANIRMSLFILTFKKLDHDRFLILPKHAAHSIGDLPNCRVGFDSGQDARRQVLARARGVFHP